MIKRLKVGLYLTDFIAVLIFLLTLSSMFVTIGLGSFWNYLDEVVALICCVVIVFAVFQRKYVGEDRIIIFLSLLLLFIGLAGNFIYKYRTDLSLIGLDVLATFKGILYYLAFKIIRLNSQQIESIIKAVFMLFFCLLLIMFPLACLNLFVDIGMHENYSFGLREFSFVFSGAGNCSLIFYVIVTVPLVKVSLQKCFYRSDKVYLFLALSVWAATLRNRALAFIAIFILLATWIFYFSKRKNFKIKLWHVLLVALVAVLIGYDKIVFYFQDTKTARYNLLYYGIVTLVNCFPFGSGFATYGSAVASEYYSPLYWEYGFDTVWGLSPDYDSFSNDGLWGEILGQFGFFGTIMFCLIFFIIFYKAYKRSKDNYDKFLFLYVGLILLLGSVGTKTVMHFVIVPVFILLALKSKLCERKVVSKEIRYGKNNSFYSVV